MNNMQANNPIQFINQVMSMGKNPQSIVQQLVNQNQQFQYVFNQVKQSGMSMKDYTLNFAKQNNMDINSLIQAMSNFGIRL